MIEKIYYSDQEWQQQLTPEAYSVARKAGTEAPFSGGYWDHHLEGTYHCICCKLELFHSDSKFDSGTGWPSFYQPIGNGNIDEKKDNRLGMERIEIVCSNCGSHLGHVFNDGPNPTGLRYCVNSISLDFKQATDTLSESE